MGDLTEAQPSPAGMRRGDFLRRAGLAGAGVAGLGAVLGAGEVLAGGEYGIGSSTRTLYDRINRFSHLVCNVSDLERAKEFWETWTPMRAFVRTQTPRQAFPNLGISSGQFDGYLMRDMNDPGFSGAANPGEASLFFIHLVEWKDPTPVGTPYSSTFNAGWYRMAFKVPDTPTKYDQLVAGGVKPFHDPRTPTPGLVPVTGFGFPDPDGIVIQILRGRPFPPGAETYDHLAGGSLDIQRHVQFFEHTLGLIMAFRASSCPVPNVWDASGGSAGYDATFYYPRGDRRLYLDIDAWNDGGATSGRPYREPNHLGYVRLGIEVDDVDAAYKILARRKGLVRLAGPPTVWDLGPDAGTRKVLAFKDFSGIGYELWEMPPSRRSETPIPISC